MMGTVFVAHWSTPIHSILFNKPKRLTTIPYYSPKPEKEALHARVLLPSKEARMFMDSVEDIFKFSHARLCLGDTTMNAEAVLTLSGSQDEVHDNISKV
jgi:hypothetical protein